MAASGDRLKRLAFAVGLGRPLRAIKHRFDPPAVRFDRAERLRMRAVIQAVLEDGDTAIDVGAHEGEVLEVMLGASPSGRHLAFEPLAHLAEDLRRRFPSIAVHAVALSDHAGTAEFIHVVTRPGWSGLRERPTPGPDQLERITVETRRLDDVVPADVPIALIKIDVEGAELEVLRGGFATLSAQRPVVVFEHGLGSADHYGTTPRDVWTLLADAGLRIYDLELRGPYELERFERAFARSERVNFAAMSDEARRALE